MFNSIIAKTNGSVTELEGTTPIRLEESGVVTLNLGPEDVARYDRVGNDLVLVLKDGSTLKIENFFVRFDDNRNEIVLVDENNVTWWAQYSEPWTKFDIAEIERDVFAVPVWAGGALLAALGAATALSGGSGSASESGEEAEKPQASDDFAGVIESGVELGGNVPETGEPDVRGNVIANDISPNGGAVVTAVGAGSSVGEVGAPISGTFGTLILNEDGSYEYSLDNTLDATQSLPPGELGTERFVYTIMDENGQTSTADILIQIEGSNDQPVIGGVDDGFVREDDVLSTSGQLSVSDPDLGDTHQWTILPGQQGEYGTFSVDENGLWTYTLNNDLAEVQALNEGDTLTDQIVVRVTDSFGAFTEQVVTVTIAGVDEAGSGEGGTKPTALTGEVLEVEDLADGENTVTSTAEGSIGFVLPDGDVQVSVRPVVDDGSYLGGLTVGTPEDGGVDWAFSVEDAELDSLSEGEILTQSYEVTVTGPNGQVTQNTVTIVIEGKNDRPIALDDRSDIQPGETVTLNVLSNDTDIDSGETETLKVTKVAGQPISPGNPVTLAGGIVTLEGNGTLTFEPFDGFESGVILPYTIDDGSGASNSEAMANWVIAVPEIPDVSPPNPGPPPPRVSIIDNADPSDPEGSDGVLSTVDDLANVAIDGFVPNNRTFVSLTITDGVQVVTIPSEDIAFEPNGRFTTTADLEGLGDGPLTVVLELENNQGESSTVEDDILKDTVTTVEINPVDVRQGEIPVITGTGEVGNTVDIEIDGVPVATVIVGDDGTWTYTPDAPLPDTEVTISVTSTDEYGNTNTDTRDVVAVDVQDQVEGEPEDLQFDEAALPDGSSPVAGSDRLSSTINLGTSDGDVTEIVIAGTPISVVDLLASDVTPFGPIATTYGAITVTGYDPVSGVVSFDYVLDGSTEDHANAIGVLSDSDVLRETISILVVDGDGDTRDAELVVAVVDDVPMPVADAAVSLGEGGEVVGTGEGDANLLDNDTLGSDGAQVHQVTYVGTTGVTQTATIPEGGGTGPLATLHGTLTVNADGTWSFTSNGSVPNVGNAPVDAGFSYNLIDGDGDISGSVAQPISVTDTIPVAVDDEAQTVVEGGADLSGNVIDNDTPSNDTPLAVASFSYTNTADVETTFVFTDIVTSATVDTPTGALTVNDDGTWSFTPSDSYDHDAPDADATAGSFTYVLTDADGSTSNSAEQQITVTDSSPDTQALALALNENQLSGTGSAGNTSGVPAQTLPLGLVPNQDDIADVVFNAATIAALPVGLTSNGVPLVYATSPDGHTLTATAGATGPTVFTLDINNPDDATGTTQSITAALTGPIDQPGATQTVLNVRYAVSDIDSTVTGTATFTITDDTPLTPVNDTPVTVVEGASAVGSANVGDNLLDNDVPGADGGRIYDIGYVDRSGGAQTALIPNGGSQTVETLYGSLTVNSNGTWSYVPVATADHAQPLTDTSLRDDFTYRTIDGDNDVSPASATQQITVSDTVPEIGEPEDRTVSEANLANGSDPEASALTTTGSLNLAPGADTFNTVLTTLPTGLQSGGQALEYVVAGDDQSVVAYAGTDRTAADVVFTLDLTSPSAANAGYSFTLVGTLDHGDAASLDLEFGTTVTDSDGDSDSDTFTVTVIDDVPLDTINRTIDEDGNFSVNTSADANPTNTIILQGGTPLIGTPNGSGGIDYPSANGTVTVRADGSVFYEPAPNYSGPEAFVVRTTEDGEVTDSSVNVTVTPVSDAPTNTVDAAIVATLEDTSVAIGLNAPVVTDTGTGAGNNAVAERIGPITLTGLPAGAQLLDGSNGQLLVVGTDPVTIVLTDTPTINGATGTLALTVAEYEALHVLPPEHASENFTVTANVSSFEVDAAGDIISGVAGAAASPAEVDVLVQAVTDDAELVFDPTVSAATVPNASQIVYTGNTVADVDMLEDAPFNLTPLLAASFEDLDGSEDRSIRITNNTGQTIRVDGQNIADGASATIDIAGQTGDETSLPAISIAGAVNFSGALNGIGVEIIAQDVDPDGFSGSVPAAGPANGIAEADLSNNAITLNLNIAPVAGDVATTGLDVETQEDTAVSFLENIRVTDTSSAGGAEVITQVVFDIPVGWDYSQPAVFNGANFSVASSGATRTVTFTSGTEAEREAVLDAFEITPPAHSSLDATISVDVTTQDGASAPVEVTRDIGIVVTPVAEEIGDGSLIDTDDDGLADLALTPGAVYTTPTNEDEWFDLNSDGFDFAVGWANQDPDEIGAANDNTYALLTPSVNGETAIGAKFRWSDGGSSVEQTFGGVPIQIPASALGTVEFLPPPDVSGRFSIGVEALTEDFDDDTEGTGTPSTAISGSAELANLDVLPVADDLALTLSARVAGPEDTEIPLSIRASSSDPDETFNVTIKDIPVGATVTYGTVTFLATAGNTDFLITDFDQNEALSILPPENSNEGFDLVVDAVSVDTADIGGSVITDVSAPVSLSINVAPRGVADEATPVVTPQTYSEADIDAGLDSVVLSDLVSFSLTDADASEVLTVRISGLPNGFAPDQGALVSPPSEQGENRIWALSPTQFSAANIEVPDNFSGEITFDAQPVTTENDGDSLTGTPTAVTFTVVPSPEATVSTSATLVEDVVTSLNLEVVPQNGDTDERIETVRIPVLEVSDPLVFELYLGTGPSATSLATSGVPTVNDGGVDYYELTATQAAELSALTGPHLDGSIGSFELQYQIVDDSFDSAVGPNATTSPFQTTTFTLTGTPVTDAPDLTITNITGSAVTTVITETVPGDDASPDTVTMSADDVVEVTLNVASADVDGSEHVTRVIVENVPNGIAVLGGELLGVDSWLLTFEGVDALPINDAGGLEIPVQFAVSDQVANLPLTAISMTVQVQDRGNEADPGTLVLEDTVNWNIVTSVPGSGPPPGPALILDWTYNGTGATEDLSFALSDVIDGTIDTQSTNPNTLTIEVTDLPEGTTVEGMTRTVIDGVERYTASVTSNPGDNDAAVQALLDGLLADIVITAPADSNDNNNAPDGLSFNTSLTTKVLGGTATEQRSISPTINVDAVTDPATLTIELGAADADGVLDESDAFVPISITTENLADGAAGSIVNDDLYLQIDGSVSSLQNGTLTNADGTETYALTPVTGVPGIPDGDYFVIPNTTMGSQVDVVYTPPNLISGDITVSATVVNIETGAAELTSTNTTVLPILIGNQGVTATSTPSTGDEAPDSASTSLIQLAGLSADLVDTDGSEGFVAILLSSVPQGFLVYSGADAASAVPASNAGGDGTVNSWILAGNGETLPPYVAILPPQNWSGTLTELKLIVTSGETALDENRIDEFPIADVTVNPVANGVEATPSSTFGTEGEITSLNLNVSLIDPTDATVTSNAPDSSQETATIVVTGLGEFASFYVGTTLKTDGVSYDSGADAYTIFGLSQFDIDVLGFKQAKNALTDQDAGAPGLQIGITATSVDGADESAPAVATVRVGLFDQVPTSADDSLLWTGLGLDGLTGADTIEMRIGESLTGGELSATLSNVETLELGIDGSNTLDGLTPDDLLSVTDTDNALRVNGTGDDIVNLSGNWTNEGGGVYTGIPAGPPGDTVSLTVTGGVVVNEPSAPSPMMRFASPALGLATLTTSETSQGDPVEAARTSARSVSLRDLLSEAQDDEFGLPKPETPSPKATDQQGDFAAAADLFSRRTDMDDDLTDTTYEV